jgi:dTDP-glucose 4,6-dehydratase/UDP-glucose 4-epimerase
MTPQTILVTGGTGFIGSALVRRLVGEGHTVRVLDDDSRGSQRRLHDIADALEFCTGDVRNADTVRQAAAGVDVVVHLAAVNGTEFFYSQPELVLDVGVRGMLNVIDACRAQGVGNLMVTSSSEVYQSPPKVPTDESAPLAIPDVANPRYSYAGSKILTELIALNYGRTGFDRVAIVRPHNVYGPNMGWEHVLPQFALRAGEAIRATPEGTVPFRIQGDGRQTRAFVHIDDFTDGMMTVLAKGGHREIYHIGSTEEIAMTELAQKVLAHFGREAEIIASPAPAGGTERRCPDIAKLAALGYAPRISLDAGLPSLIDWYIENAAARPVTNETTL